MPDRPKLADAPAREAIRNCLDRNFLVEAGAGSGKTTSLVERMTALVSSGACSIDALAAVTFTRKAAGELRERFQVDLEKACRGETEPRRRRRLDAALERLDRAFIGTIHSFCSRLLRERPVEAGINPSFSEVEGMEERLLEERAWEEYMLRVRLENPGLLDLLDRLDVQPRDLKDTYHTLVRYPDVRVETGHAPCPDLEPARRELARFCDAARDLLPGEPHRDGWDKLQHVLRTALLWQHNFDLDQDRYLLRLLQRMNSKSARPVQKRWAEREDALEMERQYTEFREQVVGPALQAWQEYRHLHLMEFLVPAAEHCRELRRRENVLNFQDLLMRAAELLRDNPEVRGYFQSRYTHLLVDEFQDTDPIQAEMMLYLTGAELAEKDWTRLTPRPGALFVVGDPKQSIYRFRRADIDIYDLVKNIIERTGGQVLYLTTNFRSLPGLVEWGNPAFAKIFAADTAPYQAGFVPMEAARCKDEAAAGGLLVQELEPESRRQEEVVREDAARIASWISRALQGELSLTDSSPAGASGIFSCSTTSRRPVPEDFLIIVRYKKDMTLYARELERFQVPFTISGGGDIGSSFELQELLFLLQALADPEDPVALAAALRGLFFGLSDNSLYRFKRAGGEFNFLRDIPAGRLEPETESVFREAWERLRDFWRWSRQLPPSAALERMAGELGLLPVALAGSLGKGRAGYILQALELVRRREGEGRTAFAEAVDFLALLMEEGIEEELDPEGGHAPGVRIMNLHKAKGLEAPVVILANPGRVLSPEPEQHISRSGNSAAGFFLIRKSGGGFGWWSEVLGRPPEWDARCAEEARYRQAEEMRLIYVAATRARDILLVSTYPQKPQASPWHPLAPYLEEAPVVEPLRPGPPARTRGGKPITPELLAEAAADIRTGLERLAEATYSSAAAGELARAAGEAPGMRDSGKGISWGNAVHAALEALARQEGAGLRAGAAEMGALAAEQLRRAGRPAAEREELAGLLRRVMQTPIWQRAAAALARYAEVPFGIWEDGCYISGIIDLAFRERDGGWVLVDYKSDTVTGEAHLDQLTAFYGPQPALYGKYWDALTGEPVKECGLLFTAVLRYIQL